MPARKQTWRQHTPNILSLLPNQCDSFYYEINGSQAQKETALIQ